MPANEVDPRIKEVLQEIGIPVRGLMLPQKVTDKMLQGAERIVSFGCLVPSMFPPEKFEEWQIPDPQTDEELRAVRDELVEKIKDLIQAHNF